MSKKPPNLTPKKAPRKRDTVARKRDTSWHPVFLRALAASGNVRDACKKAKIERPTAYEHREKFPEFAAAWATALEEAIEDLEAAARRRAKKSSDTLLIFLLKAHRPERYRETVRQEHTGADGGPMQVEVSDAKQRLADRLARLAQVQDPPSPGGSV